MFVCAYIAIYIYIFVWVSLITKISHTNTNICTHTHNPHTYIRYLRPHLTFGCGLFV